MMFKPPAPEPKEFDFQDQEVSSPKASGANFFQTFLSQEGDKKQKDVPKLFKDDSSNSSQEKGEDDLLVEKKVSYKEMKEEVTEVAWDEVIVPKVVSEVMVIPLEEDEVIEVPKTGEEEIDFAEAEILEMAKVEV